MVATDDAARFADWVGPSLLAMTRLAKPLAPHADPDDVVQDALALAWHKWEQFDSALGTSSNWLLGIPPGASLKFDGHDGFTASDGCNSGGGQVTINPGKLEISDYVSTQVACPGSQSSLVGKILNGSVTWSIKDGQLTLTKDGVGSLSYRPGGSAPTSPTTGTS